MTASTSVSDQLQALVKALPTQPGVYSFKDARGVVIYVGKAISLRNRVRSYFALANQGDFKVRGIVANAADLEYIVVDSDQEAFLLENTLIKKHRPRYNVRLKDDKTYPYIRINLNEPWARVEFTRRLQNDGAYYFGPYASATSVRKTMDLLNRLFPYRSCTRTITGKDPRPCLDFHIKRCLGPCIGAVGQEEYASVLKEVVLFLEGRDDEVKKDIKRKMLEASEDLNFERAAFYRDQVVAIERVTEEQKTVSTKMESEDVIAIAREKNEVWVEAFFIRGGKLIGRDNFILEAPEEEDDSTVVAGFVKQFYGSSPYVPPRILVQHPLPEDESDIRPWLEQRRKGKVHIISPVRGEKKRLVEMVAKNAQEGLTQLRVKWLADKDATNAALEQIKEELGLPRLPRRMECYDISNIQGTNSVASMVVFEDGQPKKAHYRRFQIKTVEGANDFASHQEVLRRRFKRAKTQAMKQQEAEQAGEGNAPTDSGESWAIEPDLVIIDGGKGQLNAALVVMREMDLQHIPVVGLAKQEEEIFVPDMPEPEMLPRECQALYMVQLIRDEAHRFAITYHRNLRSKRAVVSALDIVPGVGPKRKKALIRHFGSVQKIREATLDELAAAPGMTHALAAKVKEYL